MEMENQVVTQELPSSETERRILATAMRKRRRAIRAYKTELAQPPAVWKPREEYTKLPRGQQEFASTSINKQLSQVGAHMVLLQEEIDRLEQECQCLRGIGGPKSKRLPSPRPVIQGLDGTRLSHQHNSLSRERRQMHTRRGKSKWRLYPTGNK
ncbi:hypothetical protein WJX84_001455 [Apatococcus fuscideae]|uniref:Uncharacterized protein n=1 Tax=Apatococcus fuscideae TaxID=2026836 RepID=A0AAW1SWA2_9CHLO